MTRLGATHLSAKISGTALLDNVSLSLAEKSLTGIIGPNGAGKTSLLRAMLGLLNCHEGDVEMNGKKLVALTPRERARAIAYLPQNGAIHWPVSVERLVSLGRLPHQQLWQKAAGEDRAAIERAMVEADIVHLRDRIATTLSGGERARTLLARALASEAPILFADEPVAALDPAHQLKVMALLRRLADHGRTIVVVMHDLALASHFCDTLMLMNAGRVVAHGAASAVLSRAHLAHVYGVQLKSTLAPHFEPL